MARRRLTLGGSTTENVLGNQSGVDVTVVSWGSEVVGRALALVVPHFDVSNIGHFVWR